MNLLVHFILFDVCIHKYLDNSNQYLRIFGNNDRKKVKLVLSTQEYQSIKLTLIVLHRIKDINL